MNPKCRANLNAARVQAGGKPLTDAQAANIEDRMRNTMRQLARTDPAWQSYPADQRMLLGAQQAAADIAAEAKRKVENAQRQVLKTAETVQRITDSMARQKDWTHSRALVEDMQRTANYIDGVKRDNARQLMSLIEAAASKKDASLGRKALMVFFDAENPAMTRDVALEVFAMGKANTGNAAAKAGAEAWLEVTNAMRKRFNDAGGDVGKLDYGYLPQAHDVMRVLAKGQDAWAAEVLPLLDRNRYVNEAGARLSDAEVLDALKAAWETISTDGANKREPGAFKGAGSRANRGSESRQIHFKDGESYLAYQAQFGTGSMYDAMIGHIGGLSRDIGLVERYGPNPESLMRVQFDVAKRADEARGFFGQVAEDQAGPKAQWSVLSGASGAPVHAKVASVAAHVRNIETFGKLQGAVLSSITDMGTYFVTTGYNRMPYFDALTNLGRAAGKQDREFLNAHGLLAESMISDLNRWSGEHLAANWSGRIGNATMRLSLMNAWTDTMRRGFQMTMMQALGRMQKTDWASLSEWDRYRMENKGLTADDWAVIQQAAPVNYRGADMVTPDAIYAVPEAHFAAEANAPTNPVTFEARVRADAAAAQSAAAQSAADLPNVIAAIDANTALSAADKTTLKQQERGRHAGRTATANRLANELNATISKYQADYYGLSAQYADNRAGEVVAKYIGLIADESEIAVLNPDLTTRALATGGGRQAGTVGGETARAVMQFKSFPIAMISRHWRRMLDTPQGMDGAPITANRLAYSGALMVSLTALGAIAFQSKQLVSGKDPVDMTTPKFWTRALAQGGGLGFMGDMLLQDTSDDRSPLDTLGRSLLGPSFGSLADAYELTKGNADEYMAGKKTNIGAEGIRFARSHAPLVNLWYAKAAIDHAGLAALQESASPGYLARIQSKARKDWGQDYWWAPQDATPARAPDLSKIGGR